MKYDIDELLKHVLTPEEEPGEDLNREILRQVKEDGYMKNKKYKCAVVVAAAVLVAASSMTAFAARRYRSASEVAEELEEKHLADVLYVAQQNARILEEQASRNDSDARDGNRAEDGTGGEDETGAQRFETGESQSFGGYNAVLLGMVSGEGLSQYPHISDGQIRTDRTYLVVAISREDGSPIDDENEDFFVSPLVGSLNPIQNNLVYWNGNAGRYVEDGVFYCLAECDNIEYFADQNLYVCVTDTTFYQKGLYDWKETEGEIVRNEAYEGLNALFELHIDPSKANPEKARAFLEEAAQGQEAGRNSQEAEEDPYAKLPPEVRDAYEEAEAWAEQITPENIEEYCVRLEGTVQTIAPDEEGRVAFDKEVPGSHGETSFIVDWFFRGGEITVFIEPDISGGIEESVLRVFTLNEDGSVTLAIWVPKEGSKWLE